MKYPAWCLTALLLVAPTLAVAASPDIFTVDFVTQNLKKGVTTPDQVIRAFGDPHARDVRASSEGDAEERFVYIQQGSTPAKKEGRGLGALLGVARGVVGDVAGATGQRNRDVDRALGSASRIADRMATLAPATVEASPQKALTLTIVFAGGLLKSYEMN